MGDTVEDIGIEQFKSMVMTTLKRTEQSVVDTSIDYWFKKYKKIKWFHAVKQVRQEIEPSVWKPREAMRITGICLGSVDKPSFDDSGHINGIKENVVSHCIMRDDDIIQISDKGTPDVKWGGEYTFETMSGESQEGKRWYQVNDDVAPEFLRQFTDDEIMEKLNERTKEIFDLEDGEISVVKVRMTHKIFSLQNEPLIDTNESGIQLRMCCSGSQFINEVNAYISFFLNPQKFGEQRFKGMFSDHFYSALKNANKDEEMEGIMRDWIVPEGGLETFVIGRVGIKEDDRGTNYKMSPVYMMMLDVSSFELENYIESQIKDRQEGSKLNQEDVDFYLKELELLNGTAQYDAFAQILMDKKLWGGHYVEELTNNLLNLGHIYEPILGTISLVMEVVKEDKEEPSKEEPKGNEITPEILNAYVKHNPDITIVEFADFGYDVTQEMLDEVKAKTQTVEAQYDENELKGFNKDHLKDICQSLGFDTSGKKIDLIKRILEAQK